MENSELHHQNVESVGMSQELRISEAHENTNDLSQPKMCHFKIFHSGYELNVVHTELIDKIIKIASHNHHLFILTATKQLFFGSLQQHRDQENDEIAAASLRSTQIELELIRSDVIDVACSVDSIYVIDENGSVQHCPLMAFDFDKRWNDIPILNCKCNLHLTFAKSLLLNIFVPIAFLLG